MFEGFEQLTLLLGAIEDQCKLHARILLGLDSNCQNSGDKYHWEWITWNDCKRR